MDTITLIPCSQVFIPTAFSPNRNGINESFRPVTGGIVLLDYKMIIYSRWGQKMFESDDYQSGWNGTLNGIIVPSGSYAYFITYKIADPANSTGSGTLSKLRGMVTVVK